MTHNETSYREKGRAVVLAALMVLSVVAMSTAFVGGAAAAAHNGDVIGFDDQVTDGDSVVVNLSSIDTAANLTITNSSGDELYNDSISADDENQSEYEVTLDTAISSSGPLTAHLNASDGSEVTSALAQTYPLRTLVQLIRALSRTSLMKPLALTR